MPQPAVHLQFALDVVAAWADGQCPAPFDVHCDRHLGAFLHGAVAPDMGYFPGGSQAWSTKVHTVRTATFARTLLNRAASSAQIAFAYGWLTHVLADVAVHPLVNEATASAPTARSLATHVRVELGLDALLAGTDARLRAFRISSVLDQQAIRFLGDSFREVYGADIVDDRALLDMHNRVTSVLPFVVEYARRIAGAWSSGRPETASFVWRTIREWAPESVVGAYLTPAIVEASLVHAARARLDMLRNLVFYHVETGLIWLPEFDLETGMLCPKSPDALARSVMCN